MFLHQRWISSAAYSLRLGAPLNIARVGTRVRGVGSVSRWASTRMATSYSSVDHQQRGLVPPTYQMSTGRALAALIPSPFAVSTP